MSHAPTRGTHCEHGSSDPKIEKKMDNCVDEGEEGNGGEEGRRRIGGIRSGGDSGGMDEGDTKGEVAAVEEAASMI